MTSLQQFMGGDHRHCDDLFYAAEEAARAGNADACRLAFATFDHAVRQHLDVEEQLLFPRFEDATGMRMGPTVVMRGEHDEFRELLVQMTQQLGAADLQGFLGNADTFLILMQQHNLKEENVLYPMMDQALAAQREQLIDNLQHTLEPA
jgi:hemerythrin-like domain-containing protein